MMPCPASRRREALLHLAAVHDPALQPALQHALTATKAAPSVDWQGLWVAMDGDQIDAAAWVQPLANHTAQLWLPKRNNPVARQLLCALQAWVNEQPIVLCHVALPAPWSAWEETLVKSGMRVLATLEHLVWPCQAVQTPQTLTLHPFRELTLAEQQALLERVGEDSLDCPALRQVLPVEALLAGFYAQAASAQASRPAHWYRLEYQGDTVGVLLLATTTQRWSLQLMGLAPEWRGQGLGRIMIQHAQALAAQAGAQCLTLTVDVQNTPAQRVYSQAGLVREGRERLLAWC
ncbi:GNAT family N-acetyltransferase [Vreelandella aquamarina]|uniref:GNAT family N-acetyltransferase n=1 Tax=Vreelandella aquamarina TaxID=77097 RepID=UPI003850B524